MSNKAAGIHTDSISVLLPPARVDFFVLSDSTLATAQSLTKDWRFARIKLQIHQADMDFACQIYTQEKSPDLVILETNDIGNEFLEKLQKLSSTCAQGTEAVIIGPTNDVHLYRSLVGMGVCDYLVRPVSEEEVIGVIAKIILEKFGLSKVHLLSVVGGKGGVGVTSISQVISWISSQKLDQKTILMDLAGSNSTLGVAYGVEPAASFSETIKIGLSGSEDDLKRIIQKNINGNNDNLSILVCGGEPILSVRPDADQVEIFVQKILKKYPVVVLDLSGASRAVQKRMLSISTSVFVVTTPFLTALRNTRTYLNEIKSLRSHLEEVHVLLNMFGLSKSEEVNGHDIESALGVPVLARLPFSPKIFFESEAEGVPVGSKKSADSTIETLYSLIKKILNGHEKNKVEEKNGLFSFLKKDSSQGK